MHSEAPFDLLPFRLEVKAAGRAAQETSPLRRVAVPQDVFLAVFRELRPRAVVPSLRVTFCDFANANSFIQLHHGEIEVRLSDVLQYAPAEVLESLAYILLSKLYRRPVPKEHSSRYRRYLSHREVRDRIASIRKERGRKELADPQGAHHNLIEIFEEVNLAYFHGLMARPAIGWSLRAGRQTLGHYDPSHHTIIISRILDSAEVPRLAVEFVMYHEMLHIRFPTEHKGARRCIHTREFKREEKRFARYEEAKALLKSL
jgi:hypothetical protein